MTAHSKIVASLLLLLAAIAIYHVTPVSAQVLNPVQTISGEQIVVIDGSYMISGSRHITVWNNNVDTGTMVKQIYTNYTEDIVAMDALNGFVYAATSNGPKSIQKWNYLTGQEMWSAPARGNSHQDTLTDMAVSNTGVYTSSADGTIKQWSLSTGSLVATVQIATGPSGFVAPILTMHVDRGTNRLFASFGRYKALDGVGLANLLPDGDFEDISTESYLESDGFFGSWETTITSGDSAVYVDTPGTYGMVAPSGSYVLWFGTRSSTWSYALQTLSLVPGHSYQLVCRALQFYSNMSKPFMMSTKRFLYAEWSNEFGYTPSPAENYLDICGKQADVITSTPTLPSLGAFSRGTSSIFLASGKSCNIEFWFYGCGDDMCEIAIDYVEIILVQRRENFDNMEVIPVTNGGFENIVITDTSVTVIGATFGAWTKSGTGTMAIARVGSTNFYNLPAAAGSYALWMQTVTNGDTTVSQTVYLAPGTTYMVRWHFAMRYIRDTDRTINLVSSLLRVSLCGVVVANNFAAPSLVFEEASSSVYTPIGTTSVSCALELTILSGASTLRSLLIDEVELVRVRNPNLVPDGGFEGLTVTTTSLIVFPGTMVGSWTSGGHSTGHVAIVRIPSAECDNLGSLASPYVLWLQSSTSAPGISVSVTINTFVSGSAYIVRWLAARRNQGAILFSSPLLSINVFGTTVVSGWRPISALFITGRTSEFVASGTTTTLTLAISVTSVNVHMLIDNVEVVLVRSAHVAGAPPFVREYSMGTSTLTRQRDYTLPTAWLTTFPAATVPEFSALFLSVGKLYTGMSFSQTGSNCHVLEYNTVAGVLYAGARIMRCNGGSVNSIVVSGGQLYVGHIRGVFQVAIADSSYSRQLEWSAGPLISGRITDLVANSVYVVAGGDDNNIRKWRVTAAPYTPVATSTTTSTTTTTTSTRTTTTTTTSSKSTRTTTTTSSTSTRTTTTKSSTSTRKTTTTSSTSTRKTTTTSLRTTTTSTRTPTTITSSSTLAASKSTFYITGTSFNVLFTSASSKVTTLSKTTTAVLSSLHPPNPPPNETPNDYTPEDTVGALTVMELALIASAASASVFAIVGGYLYVRRRRMAKLGDYEMAKSRELLNRSEIELRPVVHTVSSSHSRFADINNIPTERTNASSLTTGRSVSRTQSHGSPNLPRMPAPILLPFSSASTLQQLPQYQRTITQSTYTGQLLPQTNRTKSDTRFCGTSGIGGRTSLMIDAQQGASPLPMLPSRTQQPDRRVSLLAQVVGDFQNRRSIAANNGGQIRMTSKTMRTNTVATSNTHRTQQTLVDHDDRGLQIPGFLQLNEATDYRVVESFASGGGGELFRGRMLAHSHSNLKVVIKRMLNSVSLPAFRQEVALIWLFNDNDHIVKLLGFNEMRLDIVMPEYTMGSLARFLDSENYSTKTAVSIALDVARGLAVMHERGIVHQDIKTDNILLEEHPKKIVHAVISDFGISNVVDNRVLTVKAFEVRNLRGLTIAYAAPEVIRRFRAKDRSLVAPRVAKAGDVYSFAIVLHAMVLRKEF